MNWAKIKYEKKAAKSLLSSSFRRKAMMALNACKADQPKNSLFLTLSSFFYFLF